VAVVNRVTKEVSLRIVYLAPEDDRALCTSGERSLHHLFSTLKPEYRGDFRQIPFGAGRLTLCDLHLPPVPGFENHRFICHLYAPQVTPADPDLLRMVLKGVDGLVVTIDPRCHQVETISGVLDRLLGRADRFASMSPPVILQLPGGTVEGEIGGIPAVPVSLERGDGIRAAFSRLVKIVSSRLDPDLLQGQPDDEGGDDPCSPVEEPLSSPPPREPFGPTEGGEGDQSGEVEVPIEVMIGGERKRLLLSIRVKSDEGDETPPLSGGGYVR